jgi:hypothetical protein
LAVVRPTGCLPLLLLPLPPPPPCTCSDNQLVAELRINSLLLAVFPRTAHCHWVSGLNWLAHFKKRAFG